MVDDRPFKAYYQTTAREVVEVIGLAEDQWQHIVDGHGDAITIEKLEIALTDPTHVYQGKAKGTSTTAIFVNENVAAEGTSKLVAGYVKLIPGEVGYVSTAFPKHAAELGKPIWVKGGQK